MGMHECRVGLNPGSGVSGLSNEADIDLHKNVNKDRIPSRRSPKHSKKA